MKDGICPKCKAEKVHITKANRTGVNVPFNSNWSAGAQANFFVCCECGYVEIYVEDKEDLVRLSKDWAKVEVKK